MLKHRWTAEERELVRLRYRQDNQSAYELARDLGVTFHAIKGQAGLLGLLKQTTSRKSWDPAQDNQLKRLIGKYSMNGIAKRMHRTVNSVAVRAKRLKLYRRYRDGSWYTKMEVCEICGVDHKRVQMWIDRGCLKASYHNEVRPSKYGSHMWHIERKDLRAFLRRYPQELNGRNVDLCQIVDILAGLEAA